jgi:translation initiation factor 2-alpha kinase 4
MSSDSNHNGSGVSSSNNSDADNNNRTININTRSSQDPHAKSAHHHSHVHGSTGSTHMEWARRERLEHARHVTEFEMLERIGEGGYGTVHKVRNRIDSHIYALKRVPLKLTATAAATQAVAAVASRSSSASSCQEQALQEVQVLSRLQHENVVRYFGAWVERAECEHDGDDDGDDDRTGTSRRSESETGYYPASLSWSDNNISGGGGGVYSEEDVDVDASKSKNRSIPSPVLVCTCQLCQSPYQDWEVSLEHWGLLDAVLQPLNLCVDCYLKSLPPSNDGDDLESSLDNTRTGTIHPHHIRLKQFLPEHLFILMEYCDCTLLEAVEEERQHYDRQEQQQQHSVSTVDDDATIIWSYFAQCVRGLAYLHSRGVIHLDIKPSNIFVHKASNNSNQVKIGDLGLAVLRPSTSTSTTANNTSGATSTAIGGSHDEPEHCFLDDDRQEDNTSPKSTSIRLQSSEMTCEGAAAVGTTLYMAPEVRTSPWRYDEKCDIFSLGIVLLELFSHFETGMERIHVLSQFQHQEEEESDTSIFSSPSGQVLPKATIKLVQQMTRRNPRDRPSCAQILQILSEEGCLIIGPHARTGSNCGGSSGSTTRTETSSTFIEARITSRSSSTILAAEENNMSDAAPPSEQVNQCLQQHQGAHAQAHIIEIESLQQQLQHRNDTIQQLCQLLQTHGVSFDHIIHHVDN